MMKLLVPLLCALAVSMLSTGCGPDQASLDALQAKLDELEPKVVAVRRIATKLRSDLDEVRSAIAQADDQLTQSRTATKKTAADQAAIQLQFASYRGDYRTAILKRAPGMELGTLMAAGKSYAAVRVKTLDTWELSFQHRDGVARVALKDLPLDLQEVFAYDPNVGVKPLAPLAQAPTNLPVIGDSSPAPSLPNAPQTLAPAPAILLYPQIQGSSGKPNEGSTSGNGKTAEVLSSWGSGGGGGSGSKVKGATATVPQGYKPIGSSMTGSNMDRNRK